MIKYSRTLYLKGSTLHVRMPPGIHDDYEDFISSMIIQIVKQLIQVKPHGFQIVEHGQCQEDLKDIHFIGNINDLEFDPILKQTKPLLYAKTRMHDPSFLAKRPEYWIQDGEDIPRFNAMGCLLIHNPKSGGCIVNALCRLLPPKQRLELLLSKVNYNSKSPLDWLVSNRHVCTILRLFDGISRSSLSNAMKYIDSIHKHEMKKCNSNFKPRYKQFPSKLCQQICLDCRMGGISVTERCPPTKEEEMILRPLINTYFARLKKDVMAVPDGYSNLLKYMLRKTVCRKENMPFAMLQVSHCIGSYLFEH